MTQISTFHAIPRAHENQRALLSIDYYGDVARLYQDNGLVNDNFYNGRRFLQEVTNEEPLTLKILPSQPLAPIYIQNEFKTEDHSPKAEIRKIEVKYLNRVNFTHRF